MPTVTTTQERFDDDVQIDAVPTGTGLVYRVVKQVQAGVVRVLHVLLGGGGADRGGGWMTTLGRRVETPRSVWCRDGGNFGPLGEYRNGWRW